MMMLMMILLHRNVRSLLRLRCCLPGDWREVSYFDETTPQLPLCLLRSPLTPPAGVSVRMMSQLPHVLPPLLRSQEDSWFAYVSVRAYAYAYADPLHTFHP